MRKILMLIGIIAVAAIAIAWSTLERRKATGKPEEAAASVQPHEIMRTLGRTLPAEYWADPF
jgi:hypothetical protein